MNVLAVGDGASFELMYGKLQAGIVFQTSWTVGLLLAVTPQSSVWPSRLIDFAKRMSVLSQVKLWATPSNVPWMNAPKFSVNAPPVKRLICCMTKLLFTPKPGAAPPGWAPWVLVKVGCNMTAKGGPFQSPPPNV